MPDQPQRRRRSSSRPGWEGSPHINNEWRSISPKPRRQPLGYMFYIYLSLGGMAGTLARYGVGEWIDSWAGWAFPWGTLTVNLVAWFILGFVIGAAGAFPLSLLPVA